MEPTTAALVALSLHDALPISVGAGPLDKPAQVVEGGGRAAAGDVVVAVEGEGPGGQVVESGADTDAQVGVGDVCTGGGAGAGVGAAAFEERPAGHGQAAVGGG